MIFHFVFEGEESDYKSCPLLYKTEKCTWRGSITLIENFLHHVSSEHTNIPIMTNSENRLNWEKYALLCDAGSYFKVLVKAYENLFFFTAKVY